MLRPDCDTTEHDGNVPHCALDVYFRRCGLVIEGWRRIRRRGYRCDTACAVRWGRWLRARRTNCCDGNAVVLVGIQNK